MTSGAPATDLAISLPDNFKQHVASGTIGRSRVSNRRKRGSDIDGVHPS
jgi:hypothetical protein